MKKLLFVAGIFALGISSSFAQDAKTIAPATAQTAVAPSRQASNPQLARKMDPKTIAQMRSTRLQRELNLTPEQTAKVQDIFLTENPDPSKRGISSNPETEKQIKAVLTPEQATKMDALKAQRDAAIKARKEQMQKQQEATQAQPAQPVQ